MPTLKQIAAQDLKPGQEFEDMMGRKLIACENTIYQVLQHDYRQQVFGYDPETHRLHAIHPWNSVTIKP